jgi:hypothetical protein
MQISGRSIPEDALAFYQPVIQWLQNYLVNPEKQTMVSFRIEYINSGSNRFVFTILKLFDECYKKGSDITVNWYYEEDDDTIKGLGKDLQSLMEIPINLVEIP